MGYIAPLSPKFMPETVRAFLQQPGYEQVTFGFRELPTRELLDGLKTFLYDVVFCIYEEGEPEVEFVPLLDQELVAIVPPDHPLAAEDQILLSQLAPYPFITYMPHVQIYRDIMAYISQSGWTPQVFCNATGEASISSLVASGFGVSIVAKTDVLDNSQVKLLHLKDRLYKRTIYMAYRRDEEQPPLCRPSCVSSSSGPGRSPTLSGTAERAAKARMGPYGPIRALSCRSCWASNACRSLRVSGEGLHRLGVGLSPLLNGVSEQELLHLHQAYGVGPLVFVQLHGDIFDIFLHLRDLYILQGIDSAAGLFDLLRQQLGGLFDLGQLQHILEHLGHGRDRVIQLS